MSKPLSFTLSAASLFLAAACGGSTSGPAAEPIAPAASEAAAPAAPAAVDGAADDKVKCIGINECSGQSACHIEGSHGCSGQNECRGKGWIEVPSADCSAKGGRVAPS